MAKKKSPKKTIYRKADKKRSATLKRSRMVSFFVGVATVVAIGVVVYHYVQGHNYRDVLGERTSIERQTPR